MTRVTGRGTSGTLPYMSPEQLRGDSPTPQQDIYSFAATMYKALEGHPPFYRGQIEYQIVHEDPQPLRSYLWPRLELGLSKNPDKRPSHAAVLLEPFSQAPATTTSRTPLEAAQSRQPDERQPVSPQAPRKARTSGLALACLGFAVFSTMLGPITGIPAIMMGHLARHRIRNASTPIQGDGEAKGGLILSYIMSVAWAIIWLFMLMK